MIDGPLIYKAFVKRVGRLASEWRKEASEPATMDTRRATLTECARKAELLLEEFGARSVEPRGSVLAPYTGNAHNGRQCAFQANFGTPCDGNGPAWQINFYDRSVIPDEPITGRIIRSTPTCFTHGAAEQSRIRQAANGEDQ